VEVSWSESKIIYIILLLDLRGMKMGVGDVGIFEKLSKEGRCKVERGREVLKRLIY